MISSIGAKIQQAGSDAFHTIEVVHNRIEDELLDVRQKLKQQKEEFAEERRQLTEKIENVATERLKGIVVKHAKRITDKIMNFSLPVVKEAMKDDDMPTCVANFYDDTIDSIWPDLKDEVVENLFVVANVTKISHGHPPACFPYNPKAWLRYSLYPYDKSFWGAIRNPIWWMFTLIALVPRYSIGQMIYILRFFLIDFSDEFQLVHYIMGFKAMQFLNLGIISAIVGAGQYYVCIVSIPTNATSATGSTNSCDSYAPVEQPFTLLVFIIQIFMTYLAFAMIYCSQKKGGVAFQMQSSAAERLQCKTEEGRQNFWSSVIDAREDEKEQSFQNQQEHGSQTRTRQRLVLLVVYDMILFVICGALLGWGMFANSLNSDANIKQRDSLMVVNWKTGMLLYWVKTLYGLFSFPFFLMQLPVISSVLVHVRPTGYNRWGVTVPLLGKAEVNPPDFYTRPF